MDAVVFCYNDQASADLITQLHEIVDVNEVCVSVLGIHLDRKARGEFKGTIPNLKLHTNVTDDSGFEKFVEGIAAYCLNEGLYRWDYVSK